MIDTVDRVLTAIVEELKTKAYVKRNERDFYQQIISCSDSKDLMHGCGGFDIVATIGDRFTWADRFSFEANGFIVGIYRDAGGDRDLLFLKEPNF